MKSASDSDLARQLITFSIRINSWLRYQIRGQAAVMGNRLTPAQFKTLFMIRRMQPCKMSTLSEHSYVSTSSLTIMLNKMVKDGLVERLNDPADRRVVRVRLTPSGEALLRQVEAKNIGLLETKLASLPAAEKDKLIEFLPKVSRLLDDSGDGTEK